MTEQKIHHDKKDSKVVFLCLILVYKRTKKVSSATYFGEEGFRRERILFLHRTSWQTHHGFAISSFGLLIKEHLLLSREEVDLERKKSKRENIEEIREKIYKYFF
jgi:hypothetical protein